MKSIYVLVTMDVEPALAEGCRPEGASGPMSYADSERFIAGYDAIASEFGFPVTYMVHPEATRQHAALLRRLAANGACLGLHLHPWKFASGRYPDHFGALTGPQQYAIVSEAAAIWMDAIGHRPPFFRPGTFSANDMSFEVLETLGFEGGSLSAPGRVYPHLNAVWAGAEPDPHRGHAAFRQVPGELDFVNIPLSVDLSVLEDRDGRRFFWDLRPDWLAADYRTIATNIVGQLMIRDPAVPVVHVVTHNDNDYSDPDDRVCRNFRSVLDAVNRAIGEAGARPVGATFADICPRVRETAARTGQTPLADATLLTG